MTLVIPLRTRSIYVFHNEALRIDRIAIKGYAVSPERAEAHVTVNLSPRVR